jgi:cytochrome P450
MGLFPKTVPVNEAPVFQGMMLLPGALVGTNMSSILRSKTLFGADAELFRPDRFMEVDKERRRQMEFDVKMAFGYG